MLDFSKLWAGAASPRVLLCTDPFSALSAQLETASGLHVGVIDGAHCTSKPKLLDQFGHAFVFPGYYGRNWDALSDCLTDLSWLSCGAFALLIRHAEQLLAESEPDLDVLAEILEDAAKHWAAQTAPPNAFHVILHTSSVGARSVKRRWAHTGTELHRLELTDG